MDALPACYRVGRCSSEDVIRYMGRTEYLDRLAPRAPEAPTSIGADERRHVAPTDAAAMRPEYAGSGDVRPQYEEAGRPRE